MTDKLIVLDPNELLGLRQVLFVSRQNAEGSPSARLLSKIGDERTSASQRGLNARLLSKIGDELAPDSDVRLKRDIEQLGTRPDGLPIYAFQYLWDDHVHVGVMAQDLIQNELWAPAIVTKPTGYYGVDYAKLGLRMTTLDEWQTKGIAALRRQN